MDDELQRFFGFTQPFGLVGDPAQLFSAPSRVGLLSGIVNDVMAGPVVTSVRGGLGVGKTCFTAQVAAEFHARSVTVVQLESAAQSPLKIQRQLGEALGIDAAATMKPDQLLQMLQAQEGLERIILLFDNAEALSVTAFRYLQLLVDLFQFGTTQLSIILIGGFGQWANLEQPDLEAIRSATTSFNMLFSLREDEAYAYLEHKFALAGRPLREVMSRSAASELLAQASGNPAEIDRLTQQALRYAYNNKQRRITPARLARALPDHDLTARPSGHLVARTALAGAVVAAMAAALFVWRDDIRDAWPGTGGGRAVMASITPPAPAPVTAALAPGAPASNTLPPPQPGPKQALSEPVHSALDDSTLGELGPARPPVEPRAIQPPSVLSAPTALTALDPLPALGPTGSDGRQLGAETPAAAAPEQPAANPGSETTAGATRPPDIATASAAVALASPPAVQPDQPSRPALTPDHILGNPDVPSSSRHGGPGLVLVARGRDDIRTLYTRVYRGMTPPPFSTVLAANPAPVHPGALLIFPEPPDGWTNRTRTP